MQWMNPAGAWALAALAAILLLYILKERLEPTEVSSTYLWRRAMIAAQAERPFQKLRRNLLMLLQLLTALALALALMHPMTLGGQASEVVFVFDLSASMQAVEDGVSRLDVAREDARRRVEGMPDGSRVSVLTAGTNVGQPLSRAEDRTAVLRALDALRAENGSADLDGALSLAMALRRELEGTQIIVYTDQALPAGDFLQPGVGNGADNRALLSLSASGNAAIARVANWGEATEVTVECYADGVLCDVRTVPAAAGETVGVSFEVPENASCIQARLTGGDALALDDTRDWISRTQSGVTVVLAGRDNVFLEKALTLRGDITLVRTTAEEAASLTGAALTIVDGPLPETLPAQGNLLLVDPDREVGDSRTESVSLAPAFGELAEEINQYLQVQDIQVARWKPVNRGTPIWLAGDSPVFSLYEADGRQIAILGFDLHDANLPLLKEFPIWVQRLLSFLAPEPLEAAVSDADCGATLEIRPQSFAQSAYVLTPSGRQVQVPLAGASFSDTGEAGVYTLVQTDASGQRTELAFALHMPASESDVRDVASGSGDGAMDRAASYGREWTAFMIGLALVLALAEWGVYRRGY